MGNPCQALATCRSSFTPERLAKHYRRFDVTSRTLLTGHSHQAWPDVGFDAQQQAWLDAARHVDDKWSHAFAMADRVKQGFASLIGERDAQQIALAASTHDLVVRFLSALPLSEKPRIVTSDGEFHSLRRQLSRLEEEGVDVVRVPSTPTSTLSARIAEAVTPATAAVMVSAVLFRDANIVTDLDQLHDTCVAHDVPFLIDAYHAINVLPFDLNVLGVPQAYCVGGGYKYCQMGEGNCFMRIPEDCDLRPVVTGWYAEFGALATQTDGVPYSSGGDRFAGSTYDPTPHYRGAAVFDHFSSLQLSPEVLRNISQRQLGILIDAFDAAHLNPAHVTRTDQPLNAIGGFLALTSPHAEHLSNTLKDRHTWTDFRGDTLRLGPAPYVTDVQLSDAMQALAEACQLLPG